MSMKVLSWYIGSINIYVNIIQTACELIAKATKKKDEPDCDNPNDLYNFLWY